MYTMKDGKRRTIIVQDKIHKAIDLVCILYKDNIITDAYIVGSVARGQARQDSDIDIVLINPSFLSMDELEPISEEFIERSNIPAEDKRELLTELADYNRLIKKLIEIGAEFKILELVDTRTDFKLPFWYQQLNGELFHIITSPNTETIKDEIYVLRLTEDLCQL